MPTLSGDTQAVLATDKVRFQGQEVAAVVADRPVHRRGRARADRRRLRRRCRRSSTPQQALADGAPLIRDDKEGQTDNLVYEWEAGDEAATDARVRRGRPGRRRSRRSTRAPTRRRSRRCGCVADVNSATGQATIYMTSQAPHAHRTLFAMVAGLPEQNIRIISPDLGGGFGNKVPIYPGYVVATAASLLIGKPVKWIENRTENLISTGFARDYHMKGELALTNDGRILGLRVNMLSDQGAFFADAQPTKFQAGLFHVVTGSYDIPAAHVVTRGRVHQQGAGRRRVPLLVPHHRGVVPHRAARADRGATSSASTRPSCGCKNFIQPEQFPYKSPTGFVYDSGDYPTALRAGARRSRLRGAARGAGRGARAEGRLIGIGIAHFTEAVGAGPSKKYDIVGLQDVRLRRAARAPDRQGDPQARREVAGPGPRDDVRPDRRRGARHPRRATSRCCEGDTDNTPYGLGTYASRSTPVARRGDRDGLAQAARQGEEDRRAPARGGRRRHRAARTASSRVKGSPDRSVTIQDVAFAAYTNLPDGMEYGLEGVHYYDPPNLTYPYGSYVVVVEVDRGTGVWKVRRDGRASTTAACGSTR